MQRIPSLQSSLSVSVFLSASIFKIITFLCYVFFFPMVRQIQINLSATEICNLGAVILGMQYNEGIVYQVRSLLPVGERRLAK